MFARRHAEDEVVETGGLTRVKSHAIQLFPVPVWPVRIKFSFALSPAPEAFGPDGNPKRFGLDSVYDEERVKEILEGKIPVPDGFYASRSAAFRAAKRDANIPMSESPKRIDMVPMTAPQSNKQLLDAATHQPVFTREYHFTTLDGTSVVIQDHSYGHPSFDIGPHINVRPANDTRNGSVPGTKAHYDW